MDHWKRIHGGMISTNDMDIVNNIHTIKFDLRNGKKYEAKKSVPEAENIDEIILKSFCVEVQTKNVIT